MAALQREQQPSAGRTSATHAAAARRPAIVTRAELAPCTCPETCERDHERD